jgi:hypothetical protein
MSRAAEDKIMQCAQSYSGCAQVSITLSIQHARSWSGAEDPIRIHPPNTRIPATAHHHLHEGSANGHFPVGLPGGWLTAETPRP